MGRTVDSLCSDIDIMSTYYDLIESNLNADKQTAKFK